MKKLILSVCFATFALSSFAQGTIFFGNNIPNSVVAPIYAGIGYQILTGNSPDGYPPGTTIYTGPPLGSGPGDYLGRFGTWTAELWGGINANSLAPITGATAVIITHGFFDTASQPVAVPGVPAGSTAALQLRVWDNQLDTVMTWAAALAAGGPLGQSATFQSLPLGNGINSPNLVGLTSFSVAVPEPTTFALAGLGFAMLWIFGRRSIAVLGHREKGRTV